MKKVLKIFLIIVLMIGILFGLTACDDDDRDDYYDDGEEILDRYDDNDRNNRQDNTGIEVLDKANESSNATKKADVNEALQMSLSVISNDYLEDYYENDLDFDEKTIEDYLTFDELNDELEDQGYIVCNEDGTRMSNFDLDKTAVGKTVYVRSMRNSDDETVYSADIVKEGSSSVTCENIDIVK